MNTFELNGFEVEFDFMDPDNMDKYEQSLKDSLRKLEALSSETSVSRAEEMRSACNVYREHFVNLFGPDTAARIFPKDHYGDMLTAIAVMEKAYRNVHASTIDTIKAINPVQTVPANRAERRTGSKKKRKRYNK